MRAFWKIKHINFYLWRKFLSQGIKIFDTVSYVWKSTGFLLEQFNKLSLKLHRGNQLISVKINKSMCFHNLFEYLLCKRIGFEIHNKKNKKKKKQKRKGHIANPIGLRLNYSNAWTDSWCIKWLKYPIFLHHILRIRNYFACFMVSDLVIRAGLLYSHFEIKKLGVGLQVIIYVLDGVFEDFVNKELNSLIMPYRKLIKKLYAKIKLYIILLKKKKKLLMKKPKDFVLFDIQLNLFITKFDLVRKKFSNVKNIKKSLMLLFKQIKIIPSLLEINTELFMKLRLFYMGKMQIRYMGISNNSVTAGLLGRYICLKLKQGYSLIELMNPISKDLAIVQQEERGFFGWKMQLKGRLKRRDRSKKYVFGSGSLPLTSSAEYIDYSYSVVHMRNSICGVKFWVHRDLDLVYTRCYVIL